MQAFDQKNTKFLGYYSIKKFSIKKFRRVSAFERVPITKGPLT